MNLNLWDNNSILEIGNPIMYFESTGIVRHRLSQVSGAQDSGCIAEFNINSDISYGLVIYGDSWTIQYLILNSNRVQISKDGFILKEITRDGNNPYSKIKIVNNSDNIISFYSIDNEELTLLHSFKAITYNVWYGVYGEQDAQCTDFNLENSFLATSENVSSLTFTSEQSTICKFERDFISLIGIANDEYNFGKLIYEINGEIDQTYNLAIQYSGPISIKINDEEQTIVNSSQLQMFRKTFNAGAIIKIELSINKRDYINNSVRTVKVYDISLQQITGENFEFKIGRNRNIIKSVGQLGFTFNIPLIDTDGLYPLIDRVFVEGQEISEFRIYIDNQKVKFLYNGAVISLDTVINSNTYYSLIASWVNGSISLTIISGAFSETKSINTTTLEYEIQDIQLFKQTDIVLGAFEELQTYGYLDNVFISTAVLSSAELLNIRNGLYVQNKNIVCLLQFNEQGIANSKFFVLSSTIDPNNLLIVSEDEDGDIPFKKVLYDKDTLNHHIQYKYLGELDPTLDLPQFPEPYTCFLVKYSSDSIWKYEDVDVDNGDLVFYYDKYYIEGFPAVYKNIELDIIDVLIDNTQKIWYIKSNNLFKIGYTEINQSIDIYYKDTLPTYMLQNTLEDDFQITTSDAIKDIYETEKELIINHLDLNPLNNIESSGFILASPEVPVATKIVMYANSKKISVNEAALIKAFLLDQYNNPIKDSIDITYDGDTMQNIFRFIGTRPGEYTITASFNEIVEIIKIEVV